MKKNRVVGLGFNIGNKTHPKSSHPYKSIHSELAALLDAGSLAHGGTAVIARKYKNGQLALAKPCQYCYQLLQQMKIKKIIYTVSNGYQIEDLPAG